MITIKELLTAYKKGEITPERYIKERLKEATRLKDYNIWTYLLSWEEIAPYIENLHGADIDKFPLYGVPFAIKDNIDLKDIPTTAACADFSYLAKASAKVVKNLVTAGAIPLGKTNLDQFATGLNGTRSPYGIVHNAFDFNRISGGSSSGSAVALAKNLVHFSLGTDTAGSGRVPAAFNHLIGLKPSCGLLSTVGLVPACRSLDCISIFANNIDEANEVLTIAEGFDARDAYSRPNPYSNSTRNYGVVNGSITLGLIAKDQLNFFGDPAYEKAYQASIEALLQIPGLTVQEIDYAPFEEAAKLLYEGPWVAERYIAAMPLIEQNPQAVHPVVREIIEQGKDRNACELFKAEYRLHALKQSCDQALAGMDALLIPTAGRFFTIEDLAKEPIRHNSDLGHYTNFMNLLDYCGLALPGKDTEEGLPFGLTLVGQKFHDRYLLSLANRLLPLWRPQPRRKTSLKEVSNPDYIEVAVCGAHLQGCALNWQLKERGAILKKETQTASIYRMYLLVDGALKRPGLLLDEKEGRAIDIEIWAVPSDAFGSFVNEIAPPLGIGKIKTQEGCWISGFIAEPYRFKEAEEITQYGSWKGYLKTLG